VNNVAFAQEQPREIRAILAGYPGDKGHSPR
jgi:hypothetical protein